MAGSRFWTSCAPDQKMGVCQLTLVWFWRINYLAASRQAGTISYYITRQSAATFLMPGFVRILHFFLIGKVAALALRTQLAALKDEQLVCCSLILPGNTFPKDLVMQSNLSGQSFGLLSEIYAWNLKWNLILRFCCRIWGPLLLFPYDIYKGRWYESKQTSKPFLITVFTASANDGLSYVPTL